MLVALLFHNPAAFIGGNVNRLKAGAVLDIPANEQAESIPAGEATRTIIAQAKDFNDFRRKLAKGVPTTQAGSASRQAAGKVQAKVEDRAAPAAAPDKLTLSKGALQGKAAAEEKIAKDRQTREAAARVAELSKNISDLNKLSGTPVASTAPATLAAPATTSPTAPGVGLSTPAALSAAPGALPGTTPAAPAVSPTATSGDAIAPAMPAASSPAGAATPAPAASAPASAAAPVKKPVIAAPPPRPEPSLIDELLENPLMLAGGAALLVLLAAFGAYRARQRKNAVSVDSSYLESRLQPDSFFGASGGQHIDTSESGATGSSLVYSPSQLGVAGDIDPIAEADVYLAYGRDLQAEEILKEAMLTSPTRVAIHAKLMEIYAKRRDIKAFKMVAAQAFNLTHGQGPEWAYISELGRDLDPGNPMYQPGGQPHAAVKATEESAQDQAAAAFGSSTILQMRTAHPKVAAAPMDFDLDLDVSLGDEPAAPAPAVAVAPAYQSKPTVAMQLPPDPIFDGLAIDFPLADTQAIKATPKAPATQATAPPPAPPAAPVVAALDSGMLEFDLSSLSLDLGSPATASPSLAVSGTSALSVSDGPLETKFALAEEFRTLGDTDGARSLAEEVATQAKGPLKSKAQSFLASLS